MAVAVEGFSIVVRLDRIQGRLSHPTFEIPNSTALFDDNLWCCSFMTEADARSFLAYLGKLGMKVERGPDCEAVLVDEFELGEERPCEWLKVARWDKAVIAWRVGTEPESVIAREGWDPKKGSGLTREQVGNMAHLEFLGEQDGVETYLNKETGQKVFSARTKSPDNRMFEKACEVIRAHLVNPGGRPVVGVEAEAVTRAVIELEKLISLDATQWNVHWFHGKGLLALGRTGDAYDSFKKAYDLEPGVEAIPRELAGVCLELGKFDEAVSVAERAASIAPDNSETLGNLALAQLMAGQLAEAKASNTTALRINPEDQINLSVRRVIDEVASGGRPQPTTLRELTKAAQPKRTEAKRPFWKFW